jgi:hypothetical protein
LEPTAKPELEQVLYCACLLKDPPDWLEETKAFDLLHHMRGQEDPCWIRQDGEAMRIGNFLDAGYLVPYY